MTEQPRPRVLIAAAAPDDLLTLELDRYLAAGLDLTVNLWRLAAATVRRGWDGRVAFTDFDGTDPAALLGAYLADGLGYDAVKTRAAVPIRAEFFAAGTDPALAHPLRVVGQSGAGVNHIDTEAAARHGVRVVNTPGTTSVAVAEFALAQLLALLRGLTEHNTAAHRGEWPKAVPRPRQLSELRLGILGFGLIGRALAARATALGMPVSAYSRSLTAEDAERLGVRRAGSPAALLAEADVLSLHLPLTPASRGLLGAAELAAMRPGSLLLNTARGGIVDEAALAAALRDPAHPLAGAAVDTFEHEHAAFASPLFGLPNALLTPHVAGMTRTAMADSAVLCADRIAGVLA
ncbi:NAD(P)-dependent oxidoreductase [Kitasatospora sp. P5_F3]